MRQGILIISGFLFIISVLTVGPAFAEEPAGGGAVAAESKPAEQPAETPSEQPKAEEKKAETSSEETKAEVKPEAKPEEAKPETKPEEEKKPETQPEEQKTESPKPEEKKVEEKPQEPKPEDKKPEDQPEEEKKPEEDDNEHEWKEQLQKKHEFFLEWLEKNYVNKYQELIKIRDSEPDKFVQRIGDVMKIYGPILHEEKRNPPLAEALREDLRLQEQRDKLIHDIRKANEDQKQALIDQLKGVVSARFDIIIRKKQLQYDQLRQRLDNLNKQLECQAEELQKLKNEKDAKVEQRLNELLNLKEGVDWK